jgi:hypothetical protein
MAYWIFKLAEQELYPDIPGKNYVYDNTHSTRVRPGDIFIYLDKRQGYSFTATGLIKRVDERVPTVAEASRTSRVRIVCTAQLEDILWFREPLSISPLTKNGKSKRAMLGIVDVNLLGWSQSIPSLSEAMYEAIMDLVEAEHFLPKAPASQQNYSVPDVWSRTRIRRAMAQFSDAVLTRHNNTCVVCGTRLADQMDAAHLSAYSIDIDNRANPANGICICTYCHRALDRRLIAISPDGTLQIASEINDEVALYHFRRITPEIRRKWLEGVEPRFLELTMKWFEERKINRV